MIFRTQKDKIEKKMNKFYYKKRLIQIHFKLRSHKIKNKNRIFIQKSNINEFKLSQKNRI